MVRTVDLQSSRISSQPTLSSGEFQDLLAQSKAALRSDRSALERMVCGLFGAHEIGNSQIMGPG